MTQAMFATCPRGLEPVLAGELEACGARDTRAVGGGVHFAGDLAVCYRVNLESRIASRVLVRVKQAPYRTEQDVYDVAHGVRWLDRFGVDCSIRVDVSAIRCPLKSLEFVTLRIKDAVCDRFRADAGSRPDVNTRTPDVRVHAFLDEQHITLYLDTSGEPLWKRGLRGATGEAPLRENLAAGILALTGWRPEEPFFDPMCGSGTLLLEAAQIALGIAPGSRRGFAFEQLRGFDAELWRKLREAARERASGTRNPAIFGADRDGSVLENARAALEQTGLAGAVRLERADILEVDAPANEGVLVTNPPYGVRVGEDAVLAAFYPKLGDALKARFAGWRCYILTADLRLAKLIGLKASKRTPLFNGPLECRLFEFRIVAGSMRTQRDKN
ncbi:MAG: THUMP domain-containing protein [Betaproteobacteria bacterium]|jgi:putative N6-adenine-specific DNA methylase|nr:THUMP domain-containing protein [Betaproteobacteria bacterium]